MKLYLVKYGEITLKGKNRRYFENKLLSNIRSRIEPFGAELDFYQGRIFVRSDDDRIIPVLQDTFRDHDTILKRIEEAVTDSPFLLGQRFSAADLLCASPFIFFGDGMPATPAVQAWVARCTEAMPKP